MIVNELSTVLNGLVEINLYKNGLNIDYSVVFRPHLVCTR